MAKFSIGMYVRCSNDNENPKYPRSFLLGQITAVDEVLTKVTVSFYESDERRQQFFKIPPQMTFSDKQVKRCRIADDTMISYAHNSRKARLVTGIKAKEEDGILYRYYILQNNKIKEVTEGEIVANCNHANYSPLQQIARYELHNPQWYQSRQIVSDTYTAVKAAPFGFETLLGSRTHLFPHQVDTIIRALNAPECRFMLADEVGIGKTIEACTIIKGLQYDKYDLRALIIVPDTLIYQWQTELSYKFWINVPIAGRDNVDNRKIVLVSHEYLENNAFSAADWDLCVVDETHRLLSRPALYKKILMLSKKVESILLLSATPITNMRKEYQKLLSLLNPSRYENMPEPDFEELLSRQKTIRNLVYDRMRDIEDYLRYDDVCQDFIDTFNQISGMVKDDKLKELIVAINPKSADKGLEVSKTVLAYLSEFYQIDQCIIRHRRKELKEFLVKRNHELCMYSMQGADSNYYEREVYDGVLNLLDGIVQTGVKSTANVEFTKKLLCAAFSSPKAVFAVLAERKRLNIASERDQIKAIEDYVCRWEKAVVSASESTENKNSLLIRYIRENDLLRSKTIIFTAFSQTAEFLEKLIASKFDAESVVSFHSGKDREAIQEAADTFQDNDNCKFIVCDESGGEGRNFQIAERIIHFDLPLSPFQIEQRIGRLDRIGRKAGLDVKSVVLCSDETVETDIFNIWHEGLNVFCESLCGMEIAFERIQNEIETAIYSDIVFGLSKIVGNIKNSLVEMRSEVEKERYFDIAKQLDPSKQEIYAKLIRKFTDNGGATVIDTMFAWAKMVGFLGIRTDRSLNDENIISVDVNTRESLNITCMQNAMYFPPVMTETIKRAKKRNAILGTFSRDVALRHENLAFFAPGNPMYDGIVGNAIECYKGRSTALSFLSDAVEWCGFRLVFNVKFDVEMLCKYGLHPRLMAVINQYITQNQVETYYTFDTEDELDDSAVIAEIKTLIDSSKRGRHLGERKISINPQTGKEEGKIISFMQQYNSEEWILKLSAVSRKSRIRALNEAKSCVMMDYGFSQIDNAYHAGKARVIFFDEKKIVSGLDERAAKVLQHMIRNPIIELDSIAFIDVVKRQGGINND